MILTMLCVVSEYPKKFNNGLSNNNNNGAANQAHPPEYKSEPAKARYTPTLTEKPKPQTFHPAPKSIDQPQQPSTPRLNQRGNHFKNHGGHRISPDLNERPSSNESVGSIATDRMFKSSALDNHRRGSPRSPANVHLIAQNRRMNVF